MLANINGIQIGYDDFGQGPTVLFIHDYPLQRQMWLPQVEPLVAAGFRVVLTDLRGFGESGLDGAPVEIQTYSADVIGLLDYLGVGRAVVCGLSLGGYVVFDLMEHYPQRIAGACLASSRPVADDAHERAKRAELKRLLQDGQLDSVRDELLEMLLASEGSVSAPWQQELRGWVGALKGKALLAALQAISQRKDYTFLLKKLKIPTLLAGAVHDRITHHGHVDIMASQLPNCFRAVKLAGGHLINLENVQEFNRHLLDFLLALVPRKRELAIEPLSSAI